MQLSELPERYVPHSRKTEVTPPNPRRVKYCIVNVIDDSDGMWLEQLEEFDSIAEALDYRPGPSARAGISVSKDDWSSEILFWWNGWQWVRKS